MQFILRTSNQNKLREFQRYGLDIVAEPGADLPEVEGTPEEVIIHKALAAGANVLVEDTSLDVEGFNAGVNIRWMLDTMTQQMCSSAQPIEPKAIWRVMLAYHDGVTMHVAHAETKGHLIAQPRGAGFSFDPYFVPEGYILTLGELDLLDAKDHISARKAAAMKMLSGDHKCIPVASIPKWTGAYQSA